MTLPPGPSPRPKPRPPAQRLASAPAAIVPYTLMRSIWAAVRRDDALNAEEIKAYVLTLEGLRGRPRKDGARRARLIPADTAGDFIKPLRKAGWTVSSTKELTTIRIEGSGPNGGALMITHRMFRSTARHFYVLNPPGAFPDGWLRVPRNVFERCVEEGSLPRGVRFRTAVSSCRCHKIRYPTKLRADVALVDIDMLRTFHGDSVRRECRAYRCLDDPRVWHLTSQRTWRPGDASPAAPAPHAIQESP